MKRQSEFHEYVVFDLMGHIPGITSRGMFGGYGIYFDGIFFGLIADDTLYFKVDETNQKDYEAEGSKPFHYSRKDKKAITMSYWEVPEKIMENSELLETWVLRSVDAARNSKVKKRKF